MLALEAPTLVEISNMSLMRTKNLLLLALFLFTGTLLSAQTVILTGTVSENVSGNPVPNHTVHIALDSMLFFNYNTTVQTDVNGNYSDTVNLPPAVSQGMFRIWTFDCNQQQHTLSRGFNPGNLILSGLDFVICTGPPVVTCQAGFSATAIMGTTSWDFRDASSSTGSVIGWNWDFGDGNTSTQQNPIHAYNMPGPFLVCLTIFTSDSCTSVFCDTVGTNGSGNTCQADFSHQQGTGNQVYFASLSSASAGIAAYFWDFGDGNTGTGVSPQHTYAAPGTYNVCLSIIANDSCTSTYCSNVSIQGSGNGPFALSGQVIQANPGSNTPFTNAVVYLIEFDSLTQTLTAVDTTTVDSSGFYRFIAPGGSYRVKAALTQASPQYSNFLPTYHTSALFWYNATVINLYQNIGNAHVNMISGNNPGGPGFVGGSVLQGANKTAGPGDPIEGIQVMVLNMNDTPVQYTYTDANGEYSFSNLAYGTYKVYVEVIGKTTTPDIITIDGQNPTFSDVNFLVNSSTVITSNVRPQLEAEVKVFPVPARDVLQISAQLDHAADWHIELLSLEGRTIQEINTELQSGAHEIKMEVSSLPAGIYFLKITGNEGQFVQKVLKN